MSLGFLSHRWVPEPESPLALAAALLAWDLAETDPGLPSQPLGETEWKALLGVIAQQRIAGFVLGAVRADRFPVTAQQRSDLASVDRFSSARVLWLERTLVNVSGDLAGRDIEHRVFKGPALVYTVYPASSPRVYVDIDLLVRSDQFDQAVEAITAAGARRVRPEPRRGFTARFGKGVELILPEGFSVDLHRTLAPGVFGLRIPLDDLFAPGPAITLGGRDIPCLGFAEAFLQACYHATVGNVSLKLVPLRDLVQLTRHPSFDGPRVATLSERWGARSVVADAVMLTASVLGIQDLSLLPWARSYEPTEREKREYALHREREDALWRDLRGVLQVLPGTRAKAAYITGLLFPTREYRASRSQSITSRLAKGVRLLARQRPP